MRPMKKSITNHPFGSSHPLPKNATRVGTRLVATLGCKDCFGYHGPDLIQSCQLGAACETVFRLARF
jgi:hypothetical protein